MRRRVGGSPSLHHTHTPSPILLNMHDDDDQLGSTRWSLIGRLKNWDDRTGWQRFFDCYWRLIYRTAVRAGLTEVEAQDVVQETVLSVAKEMKDFQAEPSGGSFKGWLLRITQRRIVDQLRKRKPTEPLDGLGNGSDSDAENNRGLPVADNWEGLWKEEWKANLVDRALEKVKEQVNPKQYKIFYLHVIKEQAAAEVAHALNVSRAQVYLAKHRIATLLKKEVRRKEKEERKGANGGVRRKTGDGRREGGGKGEIE